jgi:AAA ATPase domain
MSNLNPFKPGAGHMPPYLAGRTDEQDRFRQLLQQEVITENLILTGLRGVGKTVLLETLKPIARDAGWLWTGSDMSESATITEERLATRLIADVSVLTAAALNVTQTHNPMGFGGKTVVETKPVGYNDLTLIYESTPGLVADKLKAVLSIVWNAVQSSTKGIVFAYDEAQILSDKAKDKEYPLSMILEVFQSLQRQGMRLMLVLTGLPTLFPKLVEARTYSERMFHVMFLSQLSEDESRAAITVPLQDPAAFIIFGESTILTILKLSGGYPYFIQFICKEIYDVALGKLASDQELKIPEEAIVSKLDSDFFAARWDRATDRERELLIVIAGIQHCDDEFTVGDIVSISKNRLSNPFSSSLANQMLVRMSDKGLIFKNRHGKYSFAVPLLSRFIRRQQVRGGAPML